MHVWLERTCLSGCQLEETLTASIDLNDLNTLGDALKFMIFLALWPTGIEDQVCDMPHAHVESLDYCSVTPITPHFCSCHQLDSARP